MDPIRSIIVATDFSELSQAAAARAITLARPDGASIHLVHALAMPVAIPPPHFAPMPATVWQSMRAVRKVTQEKLEVAQKAIEGQGIQSVTSEIIDSRDAVEAIEAAAKAHEADLVVIGTHGHSGLKDTFLGSVAERTLRIAPCSVLVVHAEERRDQEWGRAALSRVRVPGDRSSSARNRSSSRLDGYGLA